MKQYSIVLMKPARKFIEKQNKEQQERLLKAIYKLPHEGDITPLAGLDNVYRLRVGTYRVVLSIHENVLTVEVMNIGNHGDVYM